MSLTEKELKLVARLHQEERHRWLYGIPGILVGAILVLIFWEAPFAYVEFTSLTLVERQAIAHSDAIYTVMWLAGVIGIIASLRGLFFDRERKLLLKLTSALLDAASK